MGRDTDAVKGSTPVKKMPIREEGHERSRPTPKPKRKRGWSDVFDNLTYSSGPGDNIYVYG